VNGIRVAVDKVIDEPIPFGTNAQSVGRVEVVLTDRVAALAGTATDDSGRPVVGATIVVFSTNRQHWYTASRFLRAASAGDDGAFLVSGLPVGNYYAAAIARLPSGGSDAWQDPQILDSFIRGASTVAISGAGQTVATLRVH
jgi:hypothetical protein